MDKVNKIFIKYLEKLLRKAKAGEVHFDSIDAKQRFRQVSYDGFTLANIPEGYSHVTLKYIEIDDHE